MTLNYVAYISVAYISGFSLRAEYARHGDEKQKTFYIQDDYWW